MAAGRRLRIAPLAPPPPGLLPGEKWIDVDTAQQTLVAYEGERPVFATLVSTGQKKWPTRPGVYRIYVKFAETEMNGQMGDEEPYSVATVPWTQYFAGDLALHTAYWHDRFGEARSHGCVNLTPKDARFLYRWSDPGVLPGYSMAHGILQYPGSIVRIRSSAAPEVVPEVQGYAKRVLRRGVEEGPDRARARARARAGPLLAWALLAPDGLQVEAVYAAPFSFAYRRAKLPHAPADAPPFNPPDEGMRRSHAEILRVFEKLGMGAAGRVFEGSPRYLPRNGRPVVSAAAEHLVATARAMPRGEPLYVLALGCVTNIASALRMAPNIAQRIVVVCTSGYTSTAALSNEDSFNLVQDVAASRCLFDSGVPLVYLPIVMRCGQKPNRSLR